MTIFRNILNIAHTLDNAGFGCFIAGGAVRDKVMDCKSNDIDLVTDATPDQIEALFNHTIPLGKSFGVITVIMGDESFEVATLRTDSKTGDGRHPDSITFTSDLAEDAKRRDFTINAMFLDPFTGNIIDFFGGKRDIQDRLIHAVGDPDERFHEDHLRMLRAVRFAITLDFNISRSTFDAIKRNAHLIKQISAERIQSELMKILAHRNADQGILMLDDIGLLEHILPEVSALHGVEQSAEFHPEGDVFVHTILAMVNAPRTTTALERLAILLHDVGKPKTQAWNPDKGRFQFIRHELVGSEIAEKVMRRLKFSRKEIDNVVFAVKMHMKAHLLPTMKRVKALELVKSEHFGILRTVARADMLASTGGIIAFDHKVAELERVRVPDPLIDGNDLLEAGIPQGKRIGKILSVIRRQQIEGRITTKDQALKTAKGIA